jgi:hypothetical protein
MEECNFYHNGIFKLVQRRDECIKMLRDYAE